MRRLLPLLFAALSLGAQPRPQPATAPAAKPGSVEGHLLDSATGAAIANASVTLRDTRNQVRYASVTDAAGAFQFLSVAPSEYYVLEGFVQGYMMPPAAAMRVVNARGLVVAEDAHLNKIELKMVPLGAIAGKVTDEDGEALRGVFVQALQYTFTTVSRRLDRKASATTDDRGQYRLPQLRPGRYILMAWLHTNPPVPAGPHVTNLIPAEGFLPAYYPGGPDVAQAGRILVEPASDMAGYDLRLTRAPTHHIRGQARGDLADARRDFSFSPCQSESFDLNAAQQVVLRPNGAFDIEGVTPGQYCIATGHTGGYMTSATSVVQVKGRDIDDVAIEVPAASTLRGVVRFADPTTDPLPSMRITLVDFFIGGLLHASMAVSPDGTFLARDLYAGWYAFQMPLPAGVYIRSMKAGEREIADGAIRMPSADVTVLLAKDAGQVSGNVQDSAGNPGADLPLLFAPRGSTRPDLIRAGRSDASGAFRVPNLPPGEYDAFAWDQDPAPEWRVLPFLKLVEDRATVVTVEANGRASAQLKAISAKDAQEALWKAQ